MLRTLVFLAAIGLLGHPTTVFANGDRAEDDASLDRLTHSDQFESVRTAFLEGRGQDAAAELEALLGKEEDDTLLRYLQAAAYRLTGDNEKALAAYQRILDEAEAGRYRNKAAFSKADVLAESERFDEAVAIYATEVAKITSPERKHRLAQIYIRFADGYFAGEGQKAPAYPKARDFYSRALEVGPSADEIARLQLQIGRCFIAEKKFNEAEKHLAAQLHAHPEAKLGDQIAYHLGMARVGKNDRIGARRAFLDLARDFPESPLRPEVLYHVARTYDIPAPGTDEDLERGVRFLKEIVAAGKGKPALLHQAEYEIGLAYFNRGNDEDAVNAFKAFIEAHRGKPDVTELALAYVRIGDAYFRQKLFPDAVATWKTFLAEFPAHSAWRDTQMKIINVEYDVGLTAFRNKEYDRAAKAWTEFLQRYPLDDRSPQINLLIGKIHYEKQEFEAAIAIWAKVVSKYARTNEASEAQFWIGVTHEKKLADFAKAREEYTKLTWGPYAARAKQRLQALDTKHLSVLTERSFATGEPALLKVTTRNIPSLEFRIYHLDAEAYFRKMHTLQGTESLDLALIAPDKVWTYEVPEYEKHREIATNVAMPISKAGLFVVAVSDVDLEATTVLLVTDVAIAVKAGRRDLLAYAQNVKTGQPQRDCRILVSDGKGILAEGKTDDRGFFHAADKRLREAEGVRTFAMLDSSYAGTNVGLRGSHYVEGLSARGFLFTERPVYRPGETLYFRGILRDVENGRYAFKAGALYDVSIVAPSGAVIGHSKIALSEFGTMSGTYELPASIPVGAYKLRCRAGRAAKEVGSEGTAAPTFSTSFQVAQYQLPRIQLTVEFDQKVFFRGEKITGKLRASYFHGGPVRGRAVSYRLGNTEVRQATTDERGEVLFSFETRNLSETQTLPFWSRIDDEAVEARRNVWIATTAMSLALKSMRDVYFLGEGFDVEVEARHVDGTPMVTDLALTALQVVAADGVRGEVQATKHDVKTNTETGKATVRLQLHTQGPHVLRLEGTDRFGNRIVANRHVFISGDEDKMQLRIISDWDRFVLGKPAKVNLHSRLDDGIAVLVYEGEQIHRYETRRIKKGANVLALALSEAETPNFRLSAMVLSRGRFISVSKHFAVDRGIEVELQPEETEVSPGTEVAIRIRARDIAGAGVPAEFSVALIDSAIFDMFPDPLPLIRDYFYGQRRAISSRDGSSAVFRYQGKTKAVSHEILEEERLASERGTTPRRPAINVPILGDEPLLVDSAAAILGQRGVLTRAFAGQQLMPVMQVQVMQTEAQNEHYVLAPGALNYTAFGTANAAGLEASVPAIRKLVRAATAYWNPAVRTDASGRTEVRIRLPERQAKWRLISFGVSKNTLVGRGEVELKTRRDLYAQIRRPDAVTEGDRVAIDVVVHNLAKEKRRVPVEFTAQVGGHSETFRRAVDVAPESTSTASFPLEIRRGEALALRSRVGEGDTQVVETATLPILRWATELRAGVGGVATHDVAHELKLPAGPTFARRLEITVGPTVERTFLDLARSSSRSVGVHPVERGLQILEVLEYLQSTRASAAITAPLERKVEAVLATLFVSQDKSGGYAWSRRRAAADPFVTAAAYRFMQRAADLGLRVPEQYRTAAERFLQKAYTTADDTTKAVLLHALAHGEQATFAAANRLYRMRQSLGTYGLTHLALALHRLDRMDLAREVVVVLAGRDTLTISEGKPSVAHAWFADPVEQLALATLALARVNPRSLQIQKSVDWLLEQRAQHGWASAKGAAAATAALREYLINAKPQSETYNLRVEVGDKVVRNLRFQKGASTEVITLTGADVPDGAVRLGFSIAGNGRFSYTAMLRGWVEGAKPAGSPSYVSYYRHHQPAPRIVDGKRIPSGNSTVRKSSGIRNSFSELAIGETGTVDVRIYDGQPYEGFLVHEEFIPAGCGVIPGSIEGDFQYHEAYDGRIVFYFDGRPRSRHISYELYGRLPGIYRIRPSRTTSLYRPYRQTIGSPGTLRVLAPGEKRQDSYTLTPDELYHIGKLHFDRKRLEKAEPHLLKLLQKYLLHDKYYREVVRMLLQISIAKRDAASVVRYFEILKERYPELVLSFEDMLLVGGSYAEIKEYERALQVYRAIAEASFLKEGNIAGALNSQGEFLASIDFAEKLLLEYPDLPQVVEYGYSLVHLLYSTSGRVGEVAELKAKKMRRRDLIAWAARKLQRFLLFHPSSPKADEAAFTLAAAYLDLGEYEKGTQLTQLMQKRFPESTYLDQFLYIEGYARFWLGSYRRALELLGKVESGSYPSTAGGDAPSEDKRLATYLMGQIFHAMRDPAQAISKYRVVEKDFSDAKEAIEAFERKSLQLPEVSDVAPGEKPKVKLKFRNISNAELTTYKVDLLKLYLQRRSLDGISRVNLAGVKPYHTTLLKLGDGKDYRERTREVELPLEEPGAYLVVAKGANLDASGMILVSKLTLEVEEDVASGRVRATVRRKKDQTYVGRAHVKVIGEGNRRFSSGETDLRGLYLADGIKGKVTIVAKEGTEYAFFRGKVSLGGFTRAGGKAQQKQAKSAAKKQHQSKKQILEHNLLRLNNDNQLDNTGHLMKWFSNSQVGCEVFRAK